MPAVSAVRVSATCRRHLGAAVGRCPRCATTLCVECPRCAACGSLSCVACLESGKGLCPNCVLGGGTVGGGGPIRASRTGAGEWLLTWMRPIDEGNGREAESVFGAVDRLTGVVLRLLLGVALVVALTGVVLAAFPGRDRKSAYDGVGNGSRVATLLRNPRRPPQFTDAPTAPGPAALASAPEDLRALVDGRADAGAPTWWLSRQRLPADLQFAAGETGRGGVPIPIHAGRILFAHAEGAPPETWAKEVEVWTSLTPEQEDLMPLGRWTLEQRAGPQVFSFPRRAIWGLTLRIHSNQGHPTDTTLSEFALLQTAQ